MYLDTVGHDEAPLAFLSGAFGSACAACFLGETLEDIYRRFNIDHPEDFRGHSLSVSDVVVLHDK